MNQEGGDLTPTITPVIHNAEKSKESIIVVSPPQEYFEMFSHDVTIIQQFIQTHVKLNEEMDSEFISNFNKEIHDIIQNNSSYDILQIINRLSTEKKEVIASYLNLFYRDEEISGFIKKSKRKMTEDMKLIYWVHWIYRGYMAITK
jgi:hypothetical protein